MSEQHEDQEQAAEYRTDDGLSTPSSEVPLDLADLTAGQDGDVEQRAGAFGTLRQPRVLAGAAGGVVVLATAGSAILWLQRRRSADSPPSSNGAVSGRRGRWTGLRRGRQTPNRLPAMQNRVAGLAAQGRDRARRVGTEMAARAGQLRQPSQPTRWEVAQTRMQGAQDRVGGNRFTLAAVAVAITILGGARWLDQQHGRRGR